ncbi:MAG: NAD-dependent epimerase/dehydratase family protein [Bacteroidia bacterium]|nr:NAD-dependent epimerase/dehydratase family protein [Bacteroidia bacterium]
MSLIFLTGGAGFIGFHLQQYLKTKHNFIAIDLLAENNIAANKRAKLLGNVLQQNINTAFLDELTNKPDVLIHLAAETGISGSLNNPQIYFDTNVAATFNVLEQCRKNGVKYLIYASSSSVYSPNQELMAEDSDTSNQLSFYGTTKKMSEVMIENYCKQFGITAIGLRFFTVYGSFTRPDMAAYKFMKAIKNKQPITLYNNGNVFRDFTHVSDIIKPIDLLIDKIKTEPLGTHKIFNIGNGSPISIQHYAQLIADNIGEKLLVNYEPLPANELPSTHSSTQELEQYIGYKPSCKIADGVKEMTTWFNTFNYE